MKKLIGVILILFLMSCEKEETTYTGEYKGFMYYDLPGIHQTTMARRIFSEYKDHIKIHIWDAPNTDAYTTITSGKYHISYAITDTTYCFNSMQIKRITVIGNGLFSGDSLFESGMIINNTNIGTVFEREDIGTWKGVFCLKN